jgi:holo-[acyl-carrier protein] synthase
MGLHGGGGPGIFGALARGVQQARYPATGIVMILGIGNDIIDIRRIEASLTRFGGRFVGRVFTETERARSERRTTGRHSPRAASYAKRFAAKEACAKALGTGLRKGVFWRDMEVVNLPSGQPTLRLTGGALARLHALTPKGHVPHIALTMTDDYPMAEAIVIISAVPAT